MSTGRNGACPPITRWWLRTTLSSAPNSRRRSASAATPGGAPAAPAGRSNRALPRSRLPGHSSGRSKKEGPAPCGAGPLCFALWDGRLHLVVIAVLEDVPDVSGGGEVAL